MFIKRGLSEEMRAVGDGGSNVRRGCGDDLQCMTRSFFEFLMCRIIPVIPL